MTNSIFSRLVALERDNDIGMTETKMATMMMVECSIITQSELHHAEVDVR
jgi:hypothetical protein